MPPQDGLAVVTRDLHVSYRVYASRALNLRTLWNRRGRGREFREIKAVQGVSLQADKGEAIGVVGRNGSGKSTLLQAIAGLLPATSGSVFASSQPTLLGVGAALQPNLSGRRNIELGCLALGMSRTEVDEEMDDIIEFSGLEEFIDLPLRAYSSGMRARLQFSIATAIQPEILLIDEALAVGDDIFKVRSERRIQELLNGAGTVFLVSHALGVIRDVCTRVIWIERGEAIEDGEPESVLAAYQAFSKQQANGS